MYGITGLGQGSWKMVLSLEILRVITKGTTHKYCIFVENLFLISEFLNFDTVLHIY